MSSSNEIFLHLSCWVLINLTAESEENAGPLIPAVPSILQLTQINSNDEVSIKAFGVLKNLSASEDDLEQLAQIKVIETCLSVIERQDKSELTAAAFEVLRNFLRNSEFQEAFLRHNGLNIILKKIPNATDMSLLENGWLVLSLVAAFEDDRRLQLIEKGLFDILFETLCQQRRYSTLVISAVADTINNLTIGGMIF